MTRMRDMKGNGCWKVCAALDCERRLSLVGFLLTAETTEFPSVSELAERFRTSEPSMSIVRCLASEPGLPVKELGAARRCRRRRPTGCGASSARHTSST